MNRSHVKKIILLTICLLPKLAFSGKFNGGLTGNFIDEAAGARAFGLGSSFSAVAEGAGSLIWNPAGLGFRQRTEASLSHIALFEGANLNAVSLTHSLNFPYGVGISIVTFNNDGIAQRDSLNNKTGEIDDSRLAALFGFGLEPRESCAIGFTAKYLKQSFENISSSAIDLDSGVLIKHGRYRFGIQIQNILNNKLNRDGGKDKLPFTFRIGGAINILNSLLSTIEVVHKTGLSAQIHTGLEYGFFDLAALRIGWNGNTPTFGGSLQWKDMAIDYAALKHEVLGISNRISIRLSFGNSTEVIAGKAAQGN